MLDSKQLRTETEAVARNFARRGFTLDLDAFRALEDRRKAAQVEADRLRAERNANAKAVGMAKGKGQDASALLARGEQLTGELTAAEAALAAVQAESDGWLMGLPNLLHDSVPDGRDESANLEVRRHGTPRAFDFTPLDHVELLERQGWGDPERVARVSGSRSYLLKGDAAMLEMAVLMFALDFLRGRGLEPLSTTALVRPEAFVGMCILLGLAASWLGTLLWNRASHLLPAALVGQLIVFETLAALLYAFLWYGRWPVMAESAGIVLLIAGVAGWLGWFQPVAATVMVIGSLVFLLGRALRRDELALQLGFILVGLGTLVQGAGWLIDAATTIAARLGVPDVIIGLNWIIDDHLPGEPAVVNMIEELATVHQ